MTTFEIRPAVADDAPEIARLVGHAFAGKTNLYPAALEASTGGDVRRQMQTGAAFLVAERDGVVCGCVRHREEEGILWFDLLASDAPGAGHALTRGVDRSAQDRGLRLVRTRVPDTGRLGDVFARWGYLPIGRTQESTADGVVPFLLLEKRVPLLTVREQRRSDAADIERIAGLDPWPFEQGARPGWFVLADGDRVAGVVGMKGSGGVGEVMSPVVIRGYEGRGLEVWMIERVALYAETNGYHTVETPVIPALRARERDLEERRWFPEGDVYRKRLTGRTPDPWPED